MESHSHSPDTTSELPFIFVPKATKRQDLTPLEKLIIIPANHMTRYKNLTIGQEVRSKIFGKLKEHSIETFVQAGDASYPHLSPTLSQLKHEMRYFGDGAEEIVCQ